MSATSIPAPSQRPMRSDARRNYDRLVAVARCAFTEHGADASLDDIARRAGVGPGTLYRHFPTRQVLQEAVYRDQVEALCAEAYDLLDSTSPGEALAVWLKDMVAYVATKRCLAETMRAVLDKDSELFASCHKAIYSAGEALLTRAQRDGAVRSDADVSDLLRLVHAISVATEKTPEDADRLLSLVMDGLRSQEPTTK